MEQGQEALVLEIGMDYEYCYTIVNITTVIYKAYKIVCRWDILDLMLLNRIALYLIVSLI